MESEIDYSINYRRWHDGSESELRLNSKLYKRMLDSELSGKNSQSRVLDFGCGFGSLVYCLNEYFDNVLGVDASLDQIKVAKSNGLNVKHITLSDFENWVSQNNNSFDLIFLFDVLEHIAVDDQIVFMRRICSMLALGGSIYIKVPNANSMLASRWRYIDWTHKSSFTESSLEFVCMNAGLNKIRYLVDDSSLKPRFWWLPRPNIVQFYFKNLFRWIWKCYLKSELGKQVKDIQVGYNLFIKAKRN
jgi:2-polyprenyl-3-methyl-5-hydroxy-6-metoxy-1,4-benzoquinol methylase